MSKNYIIIVDNDNALLIIDTPQNKPFYDQIENKRPMIIKTAKGERLEVFAIDKNEPVILKDARLSCISCLAANRLNYVRYICSPEHEKAHH